MQPQLGLFELYKGILKWWRRRLAWGCVSRENHIMCSFFSEKSHEKESNLRSKFSRLLNYYYYGIVSQRPQRRQQRDEW